MTDLAIIIGMATLTVSSAVLQQIMASTGKVTESQFLDTTTKCLLALTSITIFVKLIKAMRTITI